MSVHTNEEQRPSLRTGEYLQVPGKKLPVRLVEVAGSGTFKVPQYVRRSADGWRVMDSSEWFGDKGRSPGESLKEATDRLLEMDFSGDLPVGWRTEEKSNKTCRVGQVGVVIRFVFEPTNARMVVTVQIPRAYKRPYVRTLALGAVCKLYRKRIENRVNEAIAIRRMFEHLALDRPADEPMPEVKLGLRELLERAAPFFPSEPPAIDWEALCQHYTDRRTAYTRRTGISVECVEPDWFGE